MTGTGSSAYLEIGLVFPSRSLLRSEIVAVRFHFDGLM